MRKLLLGLGAIALITLSCKKNNDTNSNVTPTKDNLVGSYKLNKTTLRQGTTEVAQQVGQCQADDIYKLNSDLTYNYIDTGLTCNPNGSYDGTWDLISSSKLVMDTSDTLNIEKYDGKTLQLSMNGGSGVYYVMYLGKQ